VGALPRQRVDQEARLARGVLPRLFSMAALGAVLDPVVMAWVPAAPAPR